MNSKKAKAIRRALAPREQLETIRPEGEPRVSRGQFFRLMRKTETVPGTERQRTGPLKTLIVWVWVMASATWMTSTIRHAAGSPRGAYLAVKRLAKR